MKQVQRRSADLLLLITIVLAAGSSGAQGQAAPPAFVDRSTPSTQQGLTLLAVSRGDAQGQYTFPVPQGMNFLSGPRGNGPAGGIGLWVRGFKPSGPYRPDSQPAAFARTLNNDVLIAHIDPVFSSYSSDPRSGQSPSLYLVTLPGGYPSGYPAIDVSVTNFHGRAARWRLINLAAPYHAVAPPVALHSSFVGSGVKLSVHAWRDNGYVSQPGSSRFERSSRFEPNDVGVHYSMSGQVPAGSRWIVRIFKRQLEWEAVRPGEMEALQRSYGPQYARHPFPRPALWTAEFGTLPTSPRNFPYLMQDMVPTPYGKYNHYLRLSGELVQLATATEAVTFHNLNIHQSKPPFQYGGGRNSYVPPPSYEIGTKPQKAVTPSGISLTLLPLSALGPQGSQFAGYGGSNTIRLLLRFGQALPGPVPFQQTAVVLPRSPLYKKYHKPVTYVLQAPKPYFLEPFYGGLGPQVPGAAAQMIAALQLPFSPPVRTIKNGRVMYQQAPRSVPKHLDTLTLSIVQTAELRTIPVSFVVPVGGQPPASPFPMNAFPAARHSLVLHR